MVVARVCPRFWFETLSRWGLEAIRVQCGGSVLVGSLPSSEQGRVAAVWVKIFFLVRVPTKEV